jgi:hypothetical protein
LKCEDPLTAFETWQFVLNLPVPVQEKSLYRAQSCSYHYITNDLKTQDFVTNIPIKLPQQHIDNNTMETARMMYLFCTVALVSTLVQGGTGTVSTRNNSFRSRNRQNLYRKTESLDIDTSTPSFPSEFSCVDDFTGFLDLTYTYSMETVNDKDIYPIIKNIEGEILLALSDTVLPCVKTQQNLASDVTWDPGYTFDKKSVGIVAINSSPRDKPSELSKFP